MKRPDDEQNRIVEMNQMVNRARERHTCAPGENQSPSDSAIRCPLRAAAAPVSSAPALETSDRILTFAELDEWVEGTAARLAEAGLQSGDRLGLWLDNGWELVVLILASIRCGVVACPVSTRLPSVDSALEQIDARMLLADRRTAASVERCAPTDFLARASGATGAILHQPDQHATIIFTSGSSGAPKAALHSYGNHYYNAAGSNSNIAVGRGDRWLLTLPLYHVGGLAILFRCLLGQATVIIREGKPLRESLSDVTHVSLVSTQAIRLLREDASFHHLKAALLGGSEMPNRLISEAFERGWPVHTSYGLTEMTSQVSTTRPSASLEELRTSGRVLPHREAKLSPDGEVLVRGATRFVGYVDRADLLQPFDEGGWYATGDFGRFTPDGLLQIIGRHDNIFVSGGENIMPEEIEAALTTLQGVARAVVVPITSPEYGYRPVAFVEVVDSGLDPQQLRADLKQMLPGFKIPDRFFPWPADKTQAQGGLKVDRKYFREEAERRFRGQGLPGGVL